LVKRTETKDGIRYAQDNITDFVISGEVSKYLDLTDFRQNLYKKGKTSQDANGILVVYLFEIFIPQLNIPDGDKKIKSKDKS
jgi:hypothetical protein